MDVTRARFAPAHGSYRPLAAPRAAFNAGRAAAGFPVSRIFLSRGRARRRGCEARARGEDALEWDDGDGCVRERATGETRSAFRADDCTHSY